MWVHEDYNLRHSTGVANLFPFSYECLIDHIIFVWGPRNLVSGCIQICMLLWEWCEGETDFLMGMIWFGERREILRGKCRTTGTELCLSLSWLWQSWVIHQNTCFYLEFLLTLRAIGWLVTICLFYISPTFGGRHKRGSWSTPFAFSFPLHFLYFILLYLSLFTSECDF